MLWLLSAMLIVLVYSVLALMLFTFIVSFAFRLYITLKCVIQDTHTQDSVTIGFFHPNASDGGGGERVLWCAVQAVQRISREINVILYTGDDLSSEELVARAKKQFNIDIPRGIEVIRLTKRYLLEAKHWPRFTLLGQSVGSMLVALEGLKKKIPDIWIDTVGCAFSYPLAKLYGGCQVISYTHYPTISTDMLQVVRERRPTFNNQAAASSLLKTMCKLVYYWMFSALYGFVGRFADVVMVNSSWTRGHIDSIWRIPDRTFTVFPPCDTRGLVEYSKSHEPKRRERQILSVAQFRPEKDHRLQLSAFQQFREEFPQHRDVKLILLGSCRNDDDAERIRQLKLYATELGVTDSVEFRVNAPYEQLWELLSQSSIGLHTMWNEHFGIVVVEYMAAGLVTVAHNSAGPKMDIVVPFNGQQTGMLATTADEYAACFGRVFDDEDSAMAMRTAARDSIEQRFSEQIFGRDFERCVREVLSVHTGPTVSAMWSNPPQ